MGVSLVVLKKIRLFLAFIASFLLLQGGFSVLVFFSLYSRERVSEWCVFRKSFQYRYLVPCHVRFYQVWAEIQIALAKGSRGKGCHSVLLNFLIHKDSLKSSEYIWYSEKLKIIITLAILPILWKEKLFLRMGERCGIPTRSRGARITKNFQIYISGRCWNKNGEEGPTIDHRFVGSPDNFHVLPREVTRFNYHRFLYLYRFDWLRLIFVIFPKEIPFLERFLPPVCVIFWVIRITKEHNIIISTSEFIVTVRTPFLNSKESFLHQKNIDCDSASFVSDIDRRSLKRN